MGTKLVICGAAGRMGKRIVALALEDGNFDIAGAVDVDSCGQIGTDCGQLAGVGDIAVAIDTEFPVDCDVVIDFTNPGATDETVEYCVKNNAALVLGTTGLSDNQMVKIDRAAKAIPIIYGTNMSVGMNVMFELAAKAAKMLGDDYDIEIVEKHHRFKKDSPSGSALTLAEKVCENTGKDFPDCLVHGRDGTDCLREKGTIGMHAVRAGDIVGIHSVIYSCLGETMTIKHDAHNRDNFVRGAIRAASWLTGKAAGRYFMADVLGL